MMDEWNVYLRGKLIDIVFYNRGMTADEVRRSLIDHDNYDSGIHVRKAVKRKLTKKVKGRSKK
jgi:hypothetical protein